MTSALPVMNLTAALADGALSAGRSLSRPPMSEPRGSGDETDSASAMMARVAAGDRRAFRGLSVLLSRPVLAAGQAMLRNHSDAEELAQEVLLEVWLRAAEYRPDRGTVVTWARNIARSRAIDRIRSEATRARTVAAQRLATRCELAIHQPAPMTERMHWIWMRDRFVAVFSRLSALERETLHLAYVGGMTQMEIATHTGTPEGTVKTRTRRALAKVRKALLETRSH